ncbi:MULTISPECIES: PTS sugar transporter subunit IIA [Vibrio]|uniref:PTS EIIA type-2 domain-containing protein n=1 Tax=Vibrio casei TaxID=673372 RepID=A0A368LHX2_9VIBR|nr:MULTISPECIES: PTS sugar transporter subunit IIA [Vibrio]RCS70317.1 hypothetical protein CIK83_12795 [Vibrio casei]SJN19905.1 Putative PTS system, nitrogen regulatory IIA component [Vibrio casei]HBV76967.1 hypothetical protein [Vibrio sp.]
MQTKRITFFLGAEGLPSWLIKFIHNQLMAFNGSATLLKIQTLQQVNVRDYLNAMTLAFQPFDLCQIILCGSKADIFESMVKRTLVEDCFLIEKNTKTTPQHLNFDNFYFQFFNITNELAAFNRLLHSVSLNEQTKNIEIEKAFVLQWVAKHANHMQQKNLREQLIQRESISSTGMQDGIAFPHILSDRVKKPQLICITTDKPIQWHSTMGSVTHIIGLVLPKPCQTEALSGVRNLATKLVNEDFRLFITQHHTSAELQVILSCLMGKI